MKNLYQMCGYDGVVIFPSPLYLPQTGNENWTQVYGILFHTEMNKIVDTYIGYLYGYHNFLKNGGKIDDGIWTSCDGKQYIEDIYVRNLISMVQKHDYKVLTFDEPIEIYDEETIEDWIINKDLIERIEQHLPN